MTERFVTNVGTISVATNASVVTGTGTTFSGRDRAGARVIAYPAASAPVVVGTVAEVDPRGVYGNLSLPLVTAYKGAALTNVPFELVDGLAIAGSASVSANFARYSAFLEQNAGLAFNTADTLDMSRVPNNSLFVDAADRVLKQWRNGVLELVSIASVAETIFIRPATGTTGRGVDILQNGPSSGAPAAGPLSFNVIDVTHRGPVSPSGLTGGDNADHGNWQQAVNSFRVYMRTGGANVGGESICSATFHTIHDQDSDTPSDKVGAVSLSYSNAVDLGGGGIYGQASTGVIDSGGHTLILIGHEDAVAIRGTGIAQNRTGHNVVNAGTSRAIGIDTAYAVTSSLSDGRDGGTFKTVLTNYTGLMDGASFFESTFDATLANVFDFHNVTVTGSIIDSAFVRLAGDGDLALGTSLEAWDTDRTVAQVYHSALQGIHTGTTILSSNYYVDGSGVARYLGATGAAAVIVGADGSYSFANAPAGTVDDPVTFTTRISVDPSGTLGLDTVPSAWASDRNALQVYHSSLQGVDTGTTIIGSNYHVDGAGTPRYLGATGAAALLLGADGSFNFANAPAGTIGNAITFTTQLTGDLHGNFGLGALAAWNTDRKALQLDKSSIQGINTGTTILGSNYYVDGAGQARYLGGTGAGAWVVGADGSLLFANAPAGVAGDPATFTTRVAFDTSGNPTFNGHALTLAGNLTTSGAFNLTATLTADTNVTFPASGGTLATQAYADALFAANDALLYKGALDCSANPNYPAADAGHLYKVSVAGKIGGASGTNVEVGDSALCTVDGSAAGTQAAVGANWDIIQANLDGAVIGPASSTNGHFAIFSGTGGKLIADGGAPAAIATSGSASDLSAGTVPAACMPALTGDATSSAGAVALTIANDAVTYAKMQNVSATSRFLGRKTAGAGDPEELSASDAKTILAIAASDVSGLAAIATSGSATDLSAGTLAIARMAAFGSGDVSFASGGGAGTIANDAVTYAKMQNVSATSRFLGRKTAGAGDPEELSASGAKTILALASADLSDHVEGTWTPAFVGSSTAGTGQTYGVQVGTYERDGRKITARFYLSATSLGTAAGNLQLTTSGLTAPNGAANDFGVGTVSYFGVTGLAAGSNSLSLTNSAVNSGTWNIWQNGNVAMTNLTVTQAGGFATIIGEIVFHV